jgi:ketosteroid isomerase-like protein
MNLEAEVNAILRHMEALEAAENRKDIEGMLALAVEDFTFVTRDRKIEGKHDVGEMFKGAAKNYISSKHVPIRVEVSSSGDMAWLLGYELNKRHREGAVVETKQYYVLTFKKVDSEWKEVVVCIA